jgi:mRNA-degrading endonuclease RelE of RelBE toxin-antitoxin system
VSAGLSLRFTRTAEKDLRRLDAPIRKRVLGGLDRLSPRIARSM